MAPPTTILAFEQGRLTRYQGLVADAQNALSAADVDIESSSAERSAAEQEIKKRADERAEVLAELGRIELAADADPLQDALEGITIALRQQTARYLVADDALTVARGKRSAAEKKLARAEAGVEEATKAVAAAERREDEQAPWRARLADPDFQAAIADANGKYKPTPANTPGYADAKARVEADIPTALLTRARQRQSKALATASTRALQVVAAKSAYRGLLSSNGGLSGAALAATETLDELRAALRAKAGTVEQIDAAMAALAAIPLTAPVTTAEKARITALTADGAIAAGKEKDRADGTITEAAFLPFKPKLDRWEAAVPERSWKNLQSFDEVVRFLEDLQSFDPATELSDFDAAESDCAKALFDAFEDELAVVADRENLLALVPAADSAASPDRVLSSLRGDP